MTDPGPLHTRLCDVLEVHHPILNAPMGGGDAPGALAAAVSAAGGFGMIGGTTAGGVDWLVAQLRIARDRTRAPVGVGFVSQLPGTDRLMAAALDEGVGVVAHSFADPGPFVGPAHDRGATVLCQVRTVAEARRAADAGVDVVVAQGSDAGGHTGRVPTLALLPAVVDAVAPLPVVAAGGIGDGRAIVAALVLGAEGVWIGTRFLATHEAGVGEDHKRAVLRAGADDTLLTEVYDVVARTDWPDDVAGRVVRDEFVDRWHDRVDELRRLVDRGTPPDAPARQGWWAGPAAAFVTRRERAGDVVARLATDAAAVQRARDITR